MLETKPPNIRYPMRPFVKRCLTSEILTTHEVAALTGFSIPYIRLRVQKGQLPAVLRGSVYLIDRQDAEALKRSRKTT